MGSSASKLESINFVVIGVGCSGKTTLLKRWKQEMHLRRFGGSKRDNLNPFPGFSFGSVPFHDNLLEWEDFGGRSMLRSFWKRHHFPVTAAVIYVVDSTAVDRLEQVRDELHRDVLQDEWLRSVPVVIFCNMQDLPNALPAKEIAERLGMYDPSNVKNPWTAIPCVAETGEGIAEGVQWIYNIVQQMKSGSVIVDRLVEKEKNPTCIPNADEPLYPLDYDPVTSNSTLQKFLPIQQGTECPFAKSARLWGGKAGVWDSYVTTRANVVALTEFIRRSNMGYNLDGFCIGLPGDGSTEDLGRRVRSVLTALSESDPANEHMMRKKYIGNRGWRFRFGGADFFVTTFAPCYPPTSSRYAFGAENAFILLQPEMSFLRHKLPNDTPVTSNPPRTIRDRTRHAFLKAGRGYHIPNTTKYPPAEHLVKPLKDDGETVIHWWIDADEATEEEETEDDFVHV